MGWGEAALSRPYGRIRDRVRQMLGALAHSWSAVMPEYA